VLADDAFEQHVEVTVAGGQHDFVDVVGGVHDVEGDAHVPVALGRAVAALDVGFEFHGEAEVAQDLLELLLFAVAAIDGVGVGLDDLPRLLISAHSAA
jgi:hypothetical protein